MWWRSANSTLRSGVTAGLMLLALVAVCQPPSELLVNMRRAYQDQSAVYLKRNTTYRIERTATGVIAHRDMEEDELLLKDRTGTAREEEIHYSDLIPLERLEAYTLVPNGRGTKRVPVNNIDRRDEREDYIFHDDSKVASFVMPSLISGAVAHVEHTIAYPDARLVSGHFFAGVYPTESSTLTVISDQDIDVDVRTFHLPDSLVTRTVSIEKGRRVQRFTMHQVPAMSFEDNAPSIRYYTPHAQLVVRLPDKDAAATDIDRLYRWYADHIKDTFDPPAPELKALADSLVGTVTDPRQQAAIIYRWVQQRIHYVAFEDGMNGLVPAAASEVCRTRYGDCKGMSNLLHTLLRARGLDAHLSWVGTRMLPYNYSELPTGSVDNHMIVTLFLPDTALFLDATSSYNAFGVPSEFTQGKQTLVALDPKNYVVKQIPVMKAADNMIIDSVRVRIENDGLVGTGVVRYTGYERYDLAYGLRSVQADKLTEALRRTLMKGSNKFLLDSCTVSGMEDPSGPLTIRYKFRVPDHVRRTTGRMYVPITLNDPWKGLRFRDDRKLPIELEHCIQEQHVVELELPVGCTYKESASTDAFANPAFSYTVHVAADGGLIRSSAIYSINELMLDEELSDWRRANIALMKEIGRTLVIETP